MVAVLACVGGQMEEITLLNKAAVLYACRNSHLVPIRINFEPASSQPPKTLLKKPYDL